MKKPLILLVIMILVSCNHRKQLPENSKNIIIAGRVMDFDISKTKLKLAVNRVGLHQMEILAELDSLGYFQTAFEMYIPTDIWVVYNTNFLAVAHPGDSIYIEFDGKALDRPSVLKSVKFGGDASETNKEIGEFQAMFYSNELFMDKEGQHRAIHGYGTDRYKVYLDSLRQEGRALYNSFVSRTARSREGKSWALTFIDRNYYSALVDYPIQRQMALGLQSAQGIVPEDYWNGLLDRLPITEPMLLNGSAISTYINQYHFYYLHPKILNDSIRRKFKGNDGIPSKTIDSLMVNGIVKYTKDTLLRQMVLTEFINHSFFRSDISIFEGYRQVADSIITLPFLKEPLLKEYKNLKNSLENPQLTSDQIISESKNLSIKEIMETIRSSNKGKVIYLDLWATWCAPCISEFPHSQDLRNTMDNNKVTFVYVCTDSEEKQWLSVIDKYGLEGQHYFLDKEQSSDLSELLNVKGIPFYVIFDKDGNIENKGNHLRPSSGAKEKILALLEE